MAAAADPVTGLANLGTEILQFTGLFFESKEGAAQREQQDQLIAAQNQANELSYAEQLKKFAATENYFVYSIAAIVLIFIFFIVYKNLK